MTMWSWTKDRVIIPEMPARKPHSALSPEALQLVAERFRVLAEPLRLRILQLLRDGEMNVSELTAALATTQPNASKHLRMLQETGFIARRQAGTSVYYAVADESVFELCDVVCTSLYERMSAQARVFEPSPRNRKGR
jgi:DNA-binding transcriptional ArsR family regulator